MISLLAVLAFQKTTLELERGGPSELRPRYWAVADTFIDQNEPDTNFGGAYTLAGGTSRTILIRFGDLGRIIGARRRVVSASLVLTAAGGDNPVLKSVNRVLVPWGEGPMNTLNSLFAPKDPKAKVVIPPGSATWKARLAGTLGWQTAGAFGANDSAPISGAQLVQLNDRTNKPFAIEGLGAVVEGWRNNPNRNYGLAINLSSSTEFFSSQSPSGRPKLVLETEEIPSSNAPDLALTHAEATAEGWRVHVTNLGKETSAGFSLGSAKGGALKPGEEGEVVLPRTSRANPLDPRQNQLLLRVEPDGPDADAANNDLCVFEDGQPLDVVLPSGLSAEWAKEQVQLWNEEVAPQSRFSFATEGAFGRVRLNKVLIAAVDGALVIRSSQPEEASRELQAGIARLLGADTGSPVSLPAGRIQVPGSTSRASIDPFPGLLGSGDTRFDGSVPNRLSLPYEPIYSRTFESILLEPTDLLSSSEVGAINARIGKPTWGPADAYRPFPKAVLLRVQDLIGRSLGGVELSFFVSDSGQVPNKPPILTLKTDLNGSVFLPSKDEFGPFPSLARGANEGLLLIQGSANGVTETGFLKAWQISDAYRRGNVNAAIMDLRLNLPAARPDREVDLAQDRIITDSKNSTAAELGALTDGNESTSFRLPEEVGGWVEIDLGRDRTLAEIELLTGGQPFWSKFDIVAYSTGQRAVEALLYAREIDWSWTVVNRSDSTKTAGVKSVFYRAPLQRVRYIRIINRLGGAGSLNGIRVRGAILG